MKLCEALLSSGTIEDIAPNEIGNYSNLWAKGAKSFGAEI